MLIDLFEYLLRNQKTPLVSQSVDSLPEAREVLRRIAGLIHPSISALESIEYFVDVIEGRRRGPPSWL